MYYVTSLSFLLQYQALIFSELARRMDPAVGVCEDGDAGDAGDDSICSMGQPSSSGQDGMGWSHVKPGIWDLTSEIFASGENITPLSSKSRDWYKPQKSQKSHNKVRQHFDVCLFCSFWCFWIWHFLKKSRCWNRICLHVLHCILLQKCLPTNSQTGYLRNKQEPRSSALFEPPNKVP